MKKRSFLAGLGALLATSSALASGGATSALLRINGIPTVVSLPSTTIADFALKGSASAYVDIGNMALPAGNWTIGCTVSVPNANMTDYFLLSLGAQSDGILDGASSLTIGLPGAVNNPAMSYGFAAVGKDDAGVGLAPRRSACFASANQNGLMGQDFTSSYEFSKTRTIFVQKKDGNVSFWQVDANACALKFSEQASTFGAVAAQPARLGCLGKAALSGFTGISYQRFFKTAQALTQYQMEAIASGVDPRAVVNFSAANGDLLFAFPNTPADGATFADLIQGQVATAHGTFVAPTALLPATVDQDQIRFDLDRYRVFQRNADGTADVELSGTVYGPNSTINVALTKAIVSGIFDSAVLVAYAPLAVSANGRFSGVLRGVPALPASGGGQNYRVKAQKASGGNEFLCDNYFTTGVVIEWLGQSLAEQMRTNNSYNINTGTLQNNGRFQATLTDPAQITQWGPAVRRTNAAGYGEGIMTKTMGDVLNFCVMQMNDAFSGTSIQNWINDSVTNVGGTHVTGPVGMMTAALNGIRRYKPKYIIWHQGEQGGTDYASYYAALTQLYTILSNAITWPWYFLVVPLDNNFDSSTNKDVQFQAFRAAQIDWADAMHTIDSKVILAATVNDILKADTNGDGIHKLSQVGGYGVYAERVGQTIDYLEGVAANSGLGPRIASAHWNGDATVDLTIAHNGGTGLQTIGGGSPTGFAASLSNAAPTSGPTYTSPLTISSVAITDATHIRITLSATPASAPYIWYQWGLPGLGTSDAAQGLTNAVNDNRSPAINTTRGYPLVPLSAAMSSA